MPIENNQNQGFLSRCPGAIQSCFIGPKGGHKIMLAHMEAGGGSFFPIYAYVWQETAKTALISFIAEEATINLPPMVRIKTDNFPRKSENNSIQQVRM